MKVLGVILFLIGKTGLLASLTYIVWLGIAYPFNLPILPWYIFLAGWVIVLLSQLKLNLSFKD